MGDAIAGSKSIHADGRDGDRRERRNKEKLAMVLTAGTVGIIVLYIYSLTMGVYSLSFSEAMTNFKEILLNLGPSDDLGEKIVYYIRMPRSVCVICVGAGLATAGAVMQALIRNPLVDPYITGVSSGASFGVVAVSMLGITIGPLATASVPVAAIIGAVAAFGTTMLVAEAAGGRAMSYVLAGTIISTGLSAAITMIIYFNVNSYSGIVKWMFGSFMDLNWDQAIIIALGTLIPIGIILSYAKQLNVMLLGEEQALYLGVDVRNLKRIMMVLIAVLAAFCVAYCGVIGFVGLIVPHVCRMILGGDHRLLIPASAVVGALLLLVADIFCKTVAAPGELPIGAIVSVIGVPFFLYLMVKEGRRYAM